MRGLRKLVCEGTQGAAFCACGPASLAREGVPMHPERLSALRPLDFSRGEPQALEAFCLASMIMLAYRSPCAMLRCVGVAPTRARIREGT